MIATNVLNNLKTKASETTLRISGWGRPLWRILSFSLADERIAPRQCLAVLPGRGGISVVYASRFLSRMKIKGTRHYPCREGKYPTPENLAATVLLAMNDLGAARAPVTLIVPRGWTMARTAEFPRTVRENLSAVVSYELDRLTPLDADRAFYDFRTIAEDEERLQIMLAAMRKDAMQPFLDALREKGIGVARAIVDSFAFGALGHYVHGRGGTVFAAIHADGYEGGSIREGKWLAAFTGKFSSADEQAKIQMLLEEINPLVSTLKKEGAIPEVFVDYSPSEPWWNRLPEGIQAPVRFLRQIDTGLRFSGKADTAKVPCSALGGALESLWPGARGLNLLDRGIHESAKTPMAFTLVLLVVLAGLVLFRMLSPLQVEAWKAEAIGREIASRKDEVKKVETLKRDLEKLEKEISTIDDFKNSRPMALTLLKEMTRILPKDAWLSRVRIAETSVDIEGYAASATAILSKLEASEYFQKVEFASSTFKDIRLNADRFNIKMDIEGLSEKKAAHGKKK